MPAISLEYSNRFHAAGALGSVPATRFIVPEPTSIVVLLAQANVSHDLYCISDELPDGTTYLPQYLHLILSKSYI